MNGGQIVNCTVNNQKVVEADFIILEDFKH